jgi:hypothetical protein
LQRDAWVIDENFRPKTGSLLKIRFVGTRGDLRPTLGVKMLFTANGGIRF